jgi:UDP-glucose 4-epimerase
VSGRVLVTGGAGFIGSHLVDSLVAAGEQVTVLDDFSTGERGNLSHQPASRVRVVAGSILDEAAVEEALAGCDRVYHLAVQCVRRSLGQPRQSHDINATGTLSLLEIARRVGIRRFVYCSSSEVYGNTSSSLLNEDVTPCRPVTVYGAAKLAGEYYAEAYRQTYGLPTVVVRPFNAYGPRAHEKGDLAEVVVRFLIRVLNGLPPVIFGDGANGRDFTYVTDVAQGMRLAGESDVLVGQRVNIAFGRMITVREVAQTIMEICGRNDLAVELARPRPGDVHVLRADTRRAADILNYRAGIGFEDGIRRYVDWFRRRHPDPATLLESDVENWTMPTAGSPANRSPVPS